MKRTFLIAAMTVIMWLPSLNAETFDDSYAGTYKLVDVYGSIDGDGFSATISYDEAANQVCMEFDYGQGYCESLPEDVTTSVPIDSSNFEDFQAAFDAYNDVDGSTVSYSFSEGSFSICLSDTSDGVSMNLCYVWSLVGGVTPTFEEEAVETAAEETQEYIDSLDSFEYGSSSYRTRLNQIKTELEADTRVETVETTGNDNGLWVRFKAGFDALIAALPSENKGGTGSPEGVAETPQTNAARNYFLYVGELVHDRIGRMAIKQAPAYRGAGGTIGNKSVLAVMAQYHAWKSNDDVPVIASLLQNSGYDVTALQYDAALSGSIDDFKRWDEYGMVILSSHGEATSTKVAIHTNATINPDEMYIYEEDLKNRRLIVWGNSYGVTQDFIEYHNATFENTLVYMSICKGAYNSSMADAFIAKGASAYIGYDNYVGVSFVQEEGVALFERLLQSGADMGSAFVPGTKETDADPAEMKLFGDDALAIQFEDTRKDFVANGTPSQIVAADLQQIYGHFTHYLDADDDDAFDWIYITADGLGVYKLNGMSADGRFEWSGNLAGTFSSVALSADRTSVSFGATTSDNPGAQGVANDTLPIYGHFVHYLDDDDGDGLFSSSEDPDENDAFDWIYITVDGSGVYKLNGMKSDGRFDWSGNLSPDFKTVEINVGGKAVDFDL